MDACCRVLTSSGAWVRTPRHPARSRHPRHPVRPRRHAPSLEKVGSTSYFGSLGEKIWSGIRVKTSVANLLFVQFFNGSSACLLSFKVRAVDAAHGHLIHRCKLSDAFNRHVHLRPVPEPEGRKPGQPAALTYRVHFSTNWPGVSTSCSGSRTQERNCCGISCCSRKKRRFHCHYSSLGVTISPSLCSFRDPVAELMYNIQRWAVEKLLLLFQPDSWNPISQRTLLHRQHSGGVITHSLRSELPGDLLSCCAEVGAVLEGKGWYCTPATTVTPCDARVAQNRLDSARKSSNGNGRSPHPILQSRRAAEQPR